MATKKRWWFPTNTTPFRYGNSRSPRQNPIVRYRRVAERSEAATPQSLHNRLRERLGPESQGRRAENRLQRSRRTAPMFQSFLSRETGPWFFYMLLKMKIKESRLKPRARVKSKSRGGSHSLLGGWGVAPTWGFGGPTHGKRHGRSGKEV